MNQSSKISFKKINQLAIPALIAGIAEPLLSITDLAIIGNIEHHSKESIAAIGIVGAFISMLVWVFGQSRSAISSIVSQYLGANKLSRLKTFPLQVIGLILSFSLIIVISTYPFAKDILEFYNAKNLILDYAIDYYKIRILGFPFTLYVIIVFGVFRGLQNTNYTMIIALIGTAINILFDYILVYGISDIIAPLHLKGAAYASLIAQITMAIIATYLIFKKTQITLKISLKPHHEIRKFIFMMLNLFVRSLSINIALYLGTSFSTNFGDQYIAAYTIGFNLWLTGAFIIDGYSSAGNIMSGKLFGAKDYETLDLLGKKLMIYGIILGCIIAIIGFVFYNYIGLLFTKDTQVIEVFSDSFWIILVMQPFCAIAFIYDGIFKGLGKMHILRNTLLLSTVFVYLPTLLIFDYYNYKNHAIWLAFFTWMISRSLPLFIIFNKKISY